jgi:hypothetical protein
VAVLDNIIDPVPPAPAALFIMLWPNARVEITRTAAASVNVFIGR